MVNKRFHTISPKGAMIFSIWFDFFVGK